MDWCEEDHSSEEEQQEEEQLSDHSILSLDSPWQMEGQEQPTQESQVDSYDEWDTDLEEDDSEQQNHILSTLYLKTCEMTGAIPVSYCVHHLGEPSLHLNHYNLGPVGAKALMLTLVNDIQITNLELESTFLEPKGLYYLMKMLHTNSSLQSLVNSYLKELQLSQNGLGLVGVQSLGQALKVNTTLLLLDISGNHIDDGAAMFLCQGLAINSTLRILRSVFVSEAFVELLVKTHQQRPTLDVQYNIMASVVKNVNALQIFQNFLKERNQSIMDFFQALDEERSMMVSNSAFRKAVKAANVPLNQHQIEFLIKKFDKNCKASINYRLVC
ncbi:hypothetical protein LDENG_00241060 [Lucifuga dentata]|nr:hypothetical protein LDENG_00241060 [Lucifuga dentata]